MADKIYPTDFTERTAGTAQDSDKILVQGIDAATAQYILAGTLSKKMTGIDTINTGNLPVKMAEGVLGDSDIPVSDIPTVTDISQQEIVQLYAGTQMTGSGFFVGSITSWISSKVKGLFKANVNINGNTLVGRIGVDNGTRGLSLGLYNNGTTQRVAMHASASNAVSSTPQWLVTEAELQAYVSANSATIRNVSATQQSGEELSGYVYGEDGTLTITNLGTPLLIDGVGVSTNQLLLIRNENFTGNTNVDVNGCYTVINNGSTNGYNEIILSRLPDVSIVYSDGNELASFKTYVRNRITIDGYICSLYNEL